MIDQKHIRMTDFKLHIYESAGSFPEVRIETTVVFPQLGKQITNIDEQVLKDALI